MTDSYEFLKKQSDEIKAKQKYEAMIGNMFTYNAKVRSVYDGDTCRVDIDLGCGIWLRNESIRFYGINAPEVRGDEREKGLVARDALRNWIYPLDGTVEQQVVLQTIKDKTGKYGRLLGIIWLEGVNINDAMVKHGYAEAREY